MTGLIVNTGQTKQVRYHPHHAVGFIERYLDKVWRYWLRQGSLIQGFQIGLNTGQRSPQLMADVGDKEATLPLFLVLLCRIMQDSYQTRNEARLPPYQGKANPQA